MCRVFGVIPFLIMVVFGSSFSQMNLKSKGSDGWGYTDKYEQNFNKSSIQTYFGDVKSVDTVTPLPEMTQGVQLTATVDGSEWYVHLGPMWFFLRQDNLAFSKGDKVDIKGMKVMINGRQVIMPSEIKGRGHILKVRDEEGVPYWSVWRKD